MENTDPDVSWITNYLETLLVQTWYPITVATNSWSCKQVIKNYLEKTGDDLSGTLICQSTNELIVREAFTRSKYHFFCCLSNMYSGQLFNCELSFAMISSIFFLGLEFALHDFGFRGVSSVESAGIGGAAHLVNFLGTDTLAAILTAKKFYAGAGMAGHSIPATEHSTMTTWGRQGERGAVENVMKNIPSGGLAIVVDSYDIWNMLENIIGQELKAVIEARQDNGGFLVVRPDSGDPCQVLLRVFDILGEKFGFEKNSKGFRKLPDYIRVIQGDGVSYDSIGNILEALSGAGWSTASLTFGSGGALLQRIDRDTQKCAYKCSFAVVDGKETEVFKDPVTDPGKRSKKGKLVLVNDGETWTTVREEERGDREDQLVTVFHNGDMVKEWSWQEIRTKAASAL